MNKVVRGNWPLFMRISPTYYHALDINKGIDTFMSRLSSQFAKD